MRSVPLDTRLTFCFKSFSSLWLELAIQPARTARTLPFVIANRGKQRGDGIELTRNFFEETYHAKWKHLRDVNSHCLVEERIHGTNDYDDDDDGDEEEEDDVSTSRRFPNEMQAWKQSRTRNLGMQSCLVQLDI